MNTRIAAVALAAVTAELGCAHGSDFSSWRSVSTEHLVVHAASDAEETAFQLELLYGALARALFPRARLEPIEVLVFERADGVRVETDTGGGPRSGPVFLARRDRRRERGPGTAVGRFTTTWQRAAARAFGRRFLDGALVQVPAWLEVGLGRYVATVELPPDAALFGHRPDDLAAELGRGRVVPLGEVLAARTLPDRAQQASAWGFIHYLLDGEQGTLRPRFDAMMAALLAGGGRTDGRAAVAQAFPDVPFPILEQKVRDYSVEMLGRRPSFRPYPIAITPPPRATATPSDPAHLRALVGR